MEKFKVVWIGAAVSEEGERRETNNRLGGSLKTSQGQGTENKRGAREMTQWLRPPAILVGELGLSLSAYMEPHNHSQVQFQSTRCSLVAFVGT